ncbi:nuclear transport factor 2 family protein [Rhizosaccharibacter radicis]|uniref:Nuclear transport factor 2 family protein n=1 Tax=Rhizosaccharibacter radicis TaxID=2782605 RepID=A0ABT1VUN8_9PROT|nr:nuclear transport factor 2 family protein [Acetobacteraceae bacterium KSS12]
MTAIDRLVIESEINRLLATYVHNLDDGKIEENAKLLADTRFKVGEVVVSGQDEIDQFFRSNVQHHEDGTPRTWHALSNILINVESATSAKAVSYFTVHQALDGLPLQPIVTGRYVDAFELRDGRWRFTSREVQPRLFGDVSKHVAAPANASAE